jgi:hypothetical protein
VCKKKKDDIPNNDTILASNELQRPPPPSWKQKVDEVVQVDGVELGTVMSSLISKEVQNSGTSLSHDAMPFDSLPLHARNALWANRLVIS